MGLICNCPVCCSGSNDFMIINEDTALYSGIEVSLNRQGMLRVRCYDDFNELFTSQEIVRLVNCPMCGCLKNPAIK